MAKKASLCGVTRALALFNKCQDISRATPSPAPHHSAQTPKFRPPLTLPLQPRPLHWASRLSQTTVGSPPRRGHGLRPRWEEGCQQQASDHT